MISNLVSLSSSKMHYGRSTTERNKICWGTLQPPCSPSPKCTWLFLGVGNHTPQGNISLRYILSIWWCSHWPLSPATSLNHLHCWWVCWAGSWTHFYSRTHAPNVDMLMVLGEVPHKLFTDQWHVLVPQHWGKLSFRVERNQLIVMS